MKLVNENEYGEYLEVTAEFQKKFTLKESNPNFEVYDSPDGSNRFIAGKCSRMPDDVNPSAGTLGINFHRAKPSYEEAVRFKNEFPESSWSQRVINMFAFSAANQSEYQEKSDVLDKFYGYIWGGGPQTLWVTPHSGIAERKADFYFPYPKFEMDSFVGGVAARCAYNNAQAPLKRFMASVHAYNWHGAIFDISGFGLVDSEKLAGAAKAVEGKYHKKVQNYAGECLLDSQIRILRWLEIINTLRKTLNPRELEEKYFIDKLIVGNVCKGLKLYGIEITNFTFEEFRAAFESLRGKKIQVVSCNHIYPAELVGKNLDLKGKVASGMINGAMQIECMKFYLSNAPELMSEMLLDLVHGVAAL
jgi:hypothetical protein